MTARTLRALKTAALIPALASLASSAQAGTYTWTNTAGGSFLTSTNWSGGVLPGFVADDVLDFSTLNITATTPVTLDANVTVGNLNFGDTAPSNNWTVGTGTLTGAVLTLATSTGTPTINVTNQTATINTVVSGTQGFSKTGSGTLLLGTFTNNYTGSVSVSGGALQLGAPTTTQAYTFSGSGLSISSATLSLTGTSTSTITHTYNFAALTAPISFSNATLATSSTNATTKAINASLDFTGSNTVSFAATSFTHAINFNRSVTGSGTLTFNSSGNSSAHNVNFASGISNNFTGAVILNSFSTASTVNLNSVLGASSYEVRNGWLLNNNVVGGLDSASSVTLVNTASRLNLTQGWTNTTASLTSAGTVTLLGTTASIGNLSGAGGALTTSTTATSGTTSALIVNQTSIANYAGNISQLAGTTLNITKNGAGVLTLLGSNSQTGATTINAGELRAGPNGFGATSGITVADGATVGAVVFNTTSTVAASTIALGTATGAHLAIDLAGTPSVAPLTISNPAGLNIVSGSVIDVSTTTALSLTQFPLVAYNGGLSGAGFAGLTLGLLPPRTLATLVDNTGNSTIDLNVTGIDSIKWTGANSADWDINTSQNWKTASNNVATNYLQPGAVGDVVAFDDSAVGNTTVNLTGAISPGNVTVNSSTLSYTFSGPGRITGTGGLTKSGSSLLILAGSNDYTGGTTLNAGTISFVANGLSNIGGISVTGDSALSWASGNTTDLSSRLTITSGKTLTVDTGANNVTFNTPLTSGNITKTGTGALTIPNTTSNLAGAVTVNGGSLVFGTLATNATYSFTGTSLSVNDATLSLPGSNGGTAITQGYEFPNMTGAVNLNNATMTMSSGSSTTKALNVPFNFTGNNLVSYTSTGFTHNENFNRPISGSGVVTFTWSGTTTGRSINFASGQSNSFTGAMVFDATASAGTVNVNSPIGATSYEVRNAWQLFNNVATGLDSASSITLVNTASMLQLNEAWTNPAATLTMTGGTTHLASSTSTIGALTGNSGTITASSTSGVLNVGQTAPVTFTNSLTVSTGLVNLNAGVHTGSLTLTGGSKLTINTTDADGAGAGVQGSIAGVSKVTSLSIDATSKLDIKNNGVIIPAAGSLNGSAITVDTLRAAIIAGRGGVGTGAATWSGAGGIGTSTFAFDETFDSIGYCWTGDPNLLVGPTDINGESYSAGDYVVKYCAGADADLNGLVDDTDVAVIGLTYDNGVTTGHHWYEGDFNYDGLINDDDVAIIGLAYNPSGTPLTPSFYAALSAEYGASFASAFASGASTVVPEPTSLGLLAVGAMGLLRRRK